MTAARRRQSRRQTYSPPHTVPEGQCNKSITCIFVLVQVWMCASTKDLRVFNRGCWLLHCVPIFRTAKKLKPQVLFVEFDLGNLADLDLEFSYLH